MTNKLSEKSFIELLSEKHKKSKKIRKYYKKFDRNKLKLIKKCYKKINRNVFGNQLPKDLEIRLSKKLLVKSGYCTQKATDGQRSSSITLSERLCSTPGKIIKS